MGHPLLPPVIAYLECRLEAYVLIEQSAMLKQELFRDREAPIPFLAVHGCRYFDGLNRFLVTACEAQHR
jgi:hypothetical protein